MKGNKLVAHVRLCDRCERECEYNRQAQVAATSLSLIELKPVGGGRGGRHGGGGGNRRTGAESEGLL